MRYALSSCSRLYLARTYCRKSLGARAVAEGVVLCTGASYHMSMEKVVADTANIYRIMNLPKAETLPPEAEEGLEKCLKEHGEALAPGALTDCFLCVCLRLADGRILHFTELFSKKFLLSSGV